MSSTREGDDSFVFCGTVAHSTPTNALDIRENAILGVAGGKVIFFDHQSRLQQLLQEHEIDQENVHQLTNGQFLMPGLVDCHFHSPQLSIQALGTDLGLLDWLDTYTFPAEEGFSSVEFARNAHEKTVKRTLRCGTTAAAYYSTIHRETTMFLCDFAENLGQRAFVGKVNMDMKAPDSYRETTEESLAETARFIKDVLERKYSLVTPVITPRFAVSCSKPLLDGLGRMAKEYNLPVQTHLNETTEERKLVLELHPGNATYTEVYDNANLLGPKTILAHCIQSNDNEIDIIKTRGCGVIHCSCSNITLRSGVMDLRKFLNYGVKLGLGTDVGAGYTPSILSAMRHSVDASNILAIKHAQQQVQNGHPRIPYEPITISEAFRLATLGGSEVLGLNCGNFESGREFDALLIDPNTSNSPLDIFLLIKPKTSSRNSSTQEMKTTWLPCTLKHDGYCDLYTLVHLQIPVLHGAGRPSECSESPAALTDVYCIITYSVVVIP
ncbi:guanine deaminase-like isoform X1 [Pomacea canaliculata]|uniref:guanine deaminase-like isoform X1 n=2 Tax=Pomacea canaliculata TaxID=400727 RepID=UPI000D732413|nr:guanine deaminase-like isoform X1 [Pomacea canaliculata]